MNFWDWLGTGWGNEVVGGPFVAVQDGFTSIFGDTGSSAGNSADDDSLASGISSGITQVGTAIGQVLPSSTEVFGGLLFIVVILILILFIAGKVEAL